MTYTFTVSRRSLPVRCLCVLLCLLVLWCFFMTPRAGAVVAEAELAYWGGAIVVSVLAAGGLALASGDAAKIGPAMYTALKDTGGKAWDSIQAMAAWAASAGSKVKDAAFRVGKDVWQAITDCFNKSYLDGKFSLPVPASGGLYLDDDNDVQQALTMFSKGAGQPILYLDDMTLSYRIYQGEIQVMWFVSGWDAPSVLKCYSDGYVVRNASRCEFQLRLQSGDSNIIEYGFYIYNAAGSSLDGDWINGRYLSSHPWCGTYPAGGEKIDVAGDLVYPGDDYLVKAPDLPAVDTDTGAVSWPSDAVWTKDAVAAPYPVGDDGVKVPDIPFDVPVDGTTGKALDDAGSDTDNPGKPGEGEGTGTGATAGLIGSIIELLKNFFDSPSDFRLNLDGFKNLILPDRFPFSIPFDMVKAVKLFAAAAADFVFRIDLDTQYFSVHHTVDLTPYAVPIAFFRYACVFWFAWILISRTHDLIKW